VSYSLITGFFRELPFGDYFVRSQSTRTLSHAIENLLCTMLPVMQQLTEQESRLEVKSKNFHPSTFPSCRTVVTHAALEAITAMTRVRVQDHFHANRRNGRL